MLSQIPAIFYPRLFFLLFLGFIIVTVIGTVSHEGGHYITSKLLGFSGQHVSYAYTNYGHDFSVTGLARIDSQYQYEIYNNKPFPSHDLRESLLQSVYKKFFWITVGGPAETMLAGTIGFLLLMVFQKKILYKKALNFWQWLLIFLSLFWLREIFNFVTCLVLLSAGRIRFVEDEFRIARYLHWNGWVLNIVLSIISIIVLCTVVFKFIPAKQRFTFLTAGFSGGIIGAILWLKVLGPLVMP